MKKSNTIFELRRFLILWGSQAVSNLGTAMTNFSLIIWVYGQEGTASSITLMSVCAFVPSVLFCFIAGTLADRWDKKRIMLIADLAAALGTVTVLALYRASNLQIWHLYCINFLLSFMNAFQNPAAYVATSLLVPKAHYVRASGLQAFSGSAVAILAPALGGALFALGGLQTVLLVDLATFAVAFATLLFFIKIPAIRAAADGGGEPFLKSCLTGIAFLREHAALLKIILFFAFINLIAHMGGYGLLPAMVLARSGNDQVTLGIVQAAVGIGTLAGGALVTLSKPAKSRTAVIFWACGLSFLLCDVLWGLGRTVYVWAFAAFAGNLPLPFLGANLTAIMRTKVPIELQGRVFSARDTIQYSTIPLGLFLGGMLADRVFEPLMAGGAPLYGILPVLFGEGKGSGIAAMFFIIGVIGSVSSFAALRVPTYRSLDEG